MEATFEEGAGRWIDEVGEVHIYCLVLVSREKWGVVLGCSMV